MSEGLAQGPYGVVRVGFEPATLGTQGTKLTTEPPPTSVVDVGWRLNPISSVLEAISLRHIDITETSMITSWDT